MNISRNQGPALLFGLPVAAAVLVLVSIVAGLGYPLVDGRFGPAWDVAAKGLGVAALAAAAMRLPGQRWLAAIMAAGALGDMLLEMPGGLIAGGAAFAAGHAIAILFYTRNRRPARSRGDIATAIGLVVYGAVMPGLVVPAGVGVASVTIYSLLLCTMAAAALLSRFPRQWVALGAMLFVVSDTLLIMRMGGRIIGGGAVHGLLVWYSYYLAQLFIFVGIARSPQAPAEYGNMS